MNKVFLVVTIILMFSTALEAQLPKEGYLGLFVDDAHTTYCLVPSAGQSYDYWVWALTSENGMRACEFAIEYPQGFYEYGFVVNPANPLFIGSPETGISVAFSYCQQGWVWILRATIYIGREDPCILNMIPRPGNGRFGFANCIPPFYPIEDAIYFSPIYVNYEPCPPGGPIAVKRSSWGAIKNIYKE